MKKGNNKIHDKCGAGLYFMFETPRVSQSNTSTSLKTYKGRAGNNNNEFNLSDCYKKNRSFFYPSHT